MDNLSKDSTEHIRIKRSTRKKIRLALPGMSDADRLDFVYKTSIVRAESKLKEMKFTDKLGTILYGKGPWEKTKKPRKK